MTKERIESILDEMDLVFSEEALEEIEYALSETDFEVVKVDLFEDNGKDYYIAEGTQGLIKVLAFKIELSDYEDVAYMDPLVLQAATGIHKEAFKEFQEKEAFEGIRIVVENTVDNASEVSNAYDRVLGIDTWLDTLDNVQTFGDTRDIEKTVFVIEK